MTNYQHRFTESLERLTNATVDKLSEDGSRKVSNIIKQMILNAGTKDGVNPGEALTQFAKDILSATGETPLTMIKILFAQNGVRAVPTPRLIAALKKGNLTYDNGIPDNFSITQLPQSLQGTEIEKLDVARLMNMDENGTISEMDTEAMHKSILPLSRTLHYLQDKAHAWEVIVKEFIGNDTWMHRDARMWHEFIRDNFHELQEIRGTRDAELPIKMELTVSDRFNRILRTAMLTVPDESLFDTAILDGILHRTSYLEIPSAVRAVLEASSKKRTAASQNGGQQQRRQRTGIQRINHDNQPTELRITSDQYRNKVTPFIQNNRDKVPKFDESTDECLKYVFLGYCNADCPRCKAHNQVKRGTKRFDALSKLKNSVMKNEKHSSDFQNGEAK